MLSKVETAIAHAMANCRLAQNRLEEIFPNHYLLWVSVYSPCTEKWLIHNFYPKEGERRGRHKSNLLRAWINYYTALTLALIEARVTT